MRQKTSNSSFLEKINKINKTPSKTNHKKQEEKTK